MKTKTLLFALAILLLVPARLPAQTSPVTARLVVPDARVLPGVPFDMWVELRNPSDAAITVGLYPTLIAHVAGRDDFEITPQAGDIPVLLARPHTLGAGLQFVKISPGGSQTLTLPVAYGLAPGPFFRDYRVSPPGEYRLALRLDAYPVGIADDKPLNFFGPVTSSEAIVQRVTPAGIDAKVWKRMQESANGRWTPPMLTSTTASAENLETAPQRFAVWSEVLTQYRDSAYFPYAVAAHQGNDEKYLDLALDAVNRFPASPIADVLHAAVARLMNGTSSANPRYATYQRSVNALSVSKRPTTRIRVFGREDLPPEACPPDYDCQ